MTSIPILTALLLEALTALIFPQTKEPYDGSQNITTLPEMSRKGHHQGMIGTGLLATPVGPRHFLTAAHADDAGIIRFGGVAYAVEKEFVNPDADLKLVQVRGILPQYVEVQRTDLSPGTELTLYGCSGVPESPPIKIGTDIKGWTIHFRQSGANENGRPRWGHCRVEQVTVSSLQYLWHRSDMSCPTFAIGDSGGAAFFDRRLAGIIYMPGSPSPFRASVEGPNQSGFLFDFTGLYDTFGQPATERILTLNQLIKVSCFAPWIFSIISPPVRVSCGSELSGWLSKSVGDVQSARRTPVVTGLSNAAPAELYSRASFARLGKPIRYAAPDLLRTEKYRVRLHFAGIRPAQATECRVQISVNGAILRRDFDAAPSVEPKSQVVELVGVVPNRANQIAVQIAPSTRHSVATLSGLEIVLEEP